MKLNRMLLAAALGTVLALSACGTDDVSVEEVEVSQSALGAGTGYSVPNTFNTAGLLATVGGVYNTQALGTPMELWMGVGNETAGTLVGRVTFLSGPSRVRIDLSDFDGQPGPDMFPFVASKIHMHFASTVEGIPRSKSGNPVPGLFEYTVEVTDPYQTVYEIPVELDAVGAIHLSVARLGGIEGFNFWLPNNQVTLRVVDYPSAGDPSYLRTKITNGGFISTYDMGYGAGVYEAWCIDVDRSIALNTNYPAYLYSSYEPLPSWLVGPGKIEYPENLDKINYLINNFSAGDMVQPREANCSPRLDANGAPLPLAALTYGDIQRAIWTLIDNNASTSGLGNWNQYRTNDILCETNANGEGFVPTCNDKVVFLAVPTGTPGTFNVQVVIGQPVIGEIAVACTSAAGTAWGDGKFGANFPMSKQWGTYFLTQ